MTERMTPEEARALLDGTTPGPWFFDDDMAGTVHTIGPIVPCGNELECSTDDAALAAHAPDLAAMVAGMREEWAGQYLDCDGKWDTICTYPTREEVARHLDYLCWDAYTHTRLVRRAVGEWEEA